MSHDLVKARLNLFAILQNLEQLVKLDPTVAAKVKDWDESVQFSILGGPSATVFFKNGECRHVCEKQPGARIKLLFLSPKHLNAMFDGKATPIPVKGFSRLGFLKNDFASLTQTLAQYLQPGQNGADRLKVTTSLKLATAACAVRELAHYDPAGKQVAAGIPDGALQMEILPDGPVVSLVFLGGRATVVKGKCDTPLARLAFADLHAASRILSGKGDAFREIAQGHLILQGRIPLIDSFNLILDRLGVYLEAGGNC